MTDEIRDVTSIADSYRRHERADDLRKPRFILTARSKGGYSLIDAETGEDFGRFITAATIRISPEQGCEAIFSFVTGAVSLKEL